MGAGFSNHDIFLNSPDLSVGQKQRREHLNEFWKKMIKRPAVVIGVSLGGAAAMDFALEYPQV